MGPLGPLKLTPQPVGRPWGGRLLAERYGKPAPAGGEPFGESWEACDVEGRVSVVASGPAAGMPIDRVLGRPLPLLVKLIDVAAPLSLQVHPDEQACEVIGDGARPKTEAWHVLWTEPGAAIYYGARPGVSTEKLIEACASGSAAAVEAVTNRFEVAPGDTITVPAGTVHAVGPGVVLYEVQQPSDTTYRLFDWGRLGLDGKPRPLHLDKARIAIRGPVRGDPRRETELVPGANPRILLCRSAFFRLDLLLVDAGELVVPEARRPSFLTVTGGDGSVVSEAGEDAVRAGDTLLVPAEVDFAIRPGPRGLRLLHARIPRPG